MVKYHKGGHLIAIQPAKAMYALQMDTSTVPPCKVPIAALTSTEIAHTKAVKQTHPMQMKSYLCQATCCACKRCEELQRLAERH